MGNKACISVVIAARNEEQEILNCLKSILTQAYIKEIIVVNDHSVDNTANIVQKLIKEDIRVRLFHAPELPEGWTGKTHALHIGCEHATGDYLLFTDADVIFYGHVIHDALSRMKKDNRDFLGGMFGIRCESVAESITAPMLATMDRIFMFVTANRFGAGTGAFNMFKRSMYLHVGGHEAISDHIVDDVGFARLIRRFSNHVVFDPSIAKYLQVRLFNGWLGYWKAITRSSMPLIVNRRILSIAITFLALILTLLLCLLPLFALNNIIHGIMFQDIPNIILGCLLLLLYILGAIVVDLASSHLNNMQK